MPEVSTHMSSVRSCCQLPWSFAAYCCLTIMGLLVSLYIPQARAYYLVCSYTEGGSCAYDPSTQQYSCSTTVRSTCQAQGWGGDGNSSDGDGDGGTNDSGGTTESQMAVIVKSSAEQKECTSTDRPVIIATGNKVLPETDFSVPPENMPLHVSRFYDKSLSRVGIFGSRWSSSLEYTLSFDRSGTQCHGRLDKVVACSSTQPITKIYANRTNGYASSFTKGTDNIWRDDKGSTVVVNGSGWKLTTEDGQQETYDQHGRPITIRDERNIGLTYAYNTSNQLATITHTSGRAISLTWNGSKVSSITAPNSKVYTYSYGAEGYLSGISYPDNLGSRTYHYEDAAQPGGLTGISINGVRYSRYAYYPDGRAKESGLVNGIEKSAFTYADSHTDVTNALGQSTRYQLADLDGSKRVIGIERPQTTACPASAIYTAYEANGNIDYTLDAHDVKTDYSYDADDRITQKIAGIGPDGDTAQQKITQYVWDAARKNRFLAIKTFGASTNQPMAETIYDYYPDGDPAARLLRSIKTINRTTNGVPGQQRIVTYSYVIRANGLVQTMTVDGPLTGTADAITYQYDAAGNLSSVGNSLGHTTTYSNHNGLGLPGRVTGANGEITDYTYDARGRVTLMRQYPNGTAADTKYEYNGAGLAAVTTPDGHVRRTEYDAAHRPTMEFEPVVSGYHTRTYEYNTMSLPTVIKTGTSQYRPDTRIAGVIDGVYQGDSGAYVSGWACSVYFDVSINVDLYVGGPAGSGTGIARFTANRGSEAAVAQACQASGTAYRFTINIESLRAQHGGKKIYIHGISPVGRGNYLLVRSGTVVVPTVPPPPPPPDPPQPPPNCGPVQCHEPIIFPDPGVGAAGGSDLSAQSTSIPYGTVDTIVYLDYDEAGRLRARRGEDGQNVRYTYDGNGNVETITDSMNRVTKFEYDALERLSKTTDAKLKLTEFKYDTGDRLTWVKDPRGLITTYKYDGFGQLWSQTSPDTGTTAFEYDVAGRRTKLTRNDGSYVSFTHDDLGRVTMASAPGLARDYDYDNCPNSTNALGRLCSVNLRDPNTVLAHSLFYYFPDGQLQARHDIGSGANDVTRYAYDGLGRLTRLTYPSGIAANYAYTHGKVSSLTATINGGTYNIATGIEYQPFGPAKRWTYGNGLLRTHNYDLDGRLFGISSAAGSTIRQSLTYEWNANDLITAVNNGVDADQSHWYQYDELSRLTRDTYPGDSTVIVDGFDAAGNRTKRTRSDGGAVTSVIDYPIETPSNQMLAMTGGTGRNFFYNTRGHLESSTGWLGNRTYVYDGFDRLKSTTIDGVTTSYLVNALDQRVGKTGPLGTFRYVYAGQNMLLGEHDGLGASGWKNFLYLNGEPVALVSGNGVRYFVHNDHLGRPEVVTDGNKAPAWKAANGSYSRTVTLGDPNTMKLGFPGQYWDAETDTWHNGFRDYDPYTGRYIQSDPIGLAGGLNTYAYVGGNPISRIDPLGLECNGQGCWVTPTELAYANSGNYSLYYQAAASGGDEYARRAGEVAANKGLRSNYTNWNLRNSLEKNGKSEKECDAAMEAIRVDLAKAHAKALAGATPQNPRVLTADQISNFHNQVFAKHGAGAVFGGDTFGTSALGRGVINNISPWCVSPSCRL